MPDDPDHANRQDTATRAKKAPTSPGAKFGTSSKTLFVVVLGVVLGRFVRRMRGVQAVGMRHVGVMAALVVLAGLVVLGGLAMMLRRLGVMIGSRLVMMRMRFAGHVRLPVVLTRAKLAPAV
jgi:hypothetical protein